MGVALQIELYREADLCADREIRILLDLFQPFQVGFGYFKGGYGIT